MENAILSLPEQLAWEPKVENGEKLGKADKFVVSGMGGSHLAAGLLKVANPYLDLLIHRDYGLPARLARGEVAGGPLVICISYSGNTEETLSAFDEARERGLKLAVIASGGELIARARQAGVPFIVVPKPSPSFQPRLGLGYIARALGALTGEKVEAVVDPASLRSAGDALATRLAGRVPLIYSATVNYPLAYAWKIKFNETAKLPAFANALPELCHNELESWDQAGVGTNFYVLSLEDSADDPRVTKRFQLLQQSYEARGLAGETIQFEGHNVWEKIFASLTLADWTTLALARATGIDPEAVPTIEEFKTKLKS